MNPEQRTGGQIEVGELRERLRALGYLNAGVDRFVLAPASGERSGLGLAWRLSVRIGLLAALLLGPAAAVGVAMRLPGLIAGARDAVVIVLYLALIFGAGVTLVSFVVALAVRAFAGRAPARTARRAGVGAGWLAGVGCLAYLTLWWNATGAVWNAPARTVVAIAAAVAISLLLGHAITIATLALLARGHRAGDLAAPAISWRAMVAAGTIAFLASSGLLAWSSMRSPETIAAPDFAVVPTGVRVIVIGIDGFEPELFRSVSERQRLEALDALHQQAVGTIGPMDDDPARVWTTVATGVSPGQHGVSGLELRRVAGLEGAVNTMSGSPLTRALGTVTDLARLTRPAPVSGTSRHHKTFWEVAAEKGLDAVVVNWWATWPATHTRATVISDRALLRLERGGTQSAEIAPESLYEPLRAKWPSIKTRARTFASAAVTVSMPGDVYDILLRSATLDTEQVLIARDPLVKQPDLLAVYLPGLDIAQRALFQGNDGVLPSPSSLLVRVEALRRYYVFLDRLLGNWLQSIPPDTAVLTVTHPGRVGGDRRPGICLRGGPVRGTPQPGSGTFSLAAVNPTVCYLLGLPISREVEGRPALALLDDDYVRRHPVRVVDTYGRYSAEVPTKEGKPLDEETLERLRSLGYIR